jgi:hypothetical protein
MHKTTSKEFDDFVKRQKSPSAAEQSVDWDQEREDWISYLDSLHKKIETFLRKYKDDGSIRIEYRQIELNEENIGVYFANEMIIHIGRQEITLTPIGTLLIGSKGRVDVEGSYGKAALILVDKDAVGPRPLVRVKIIDPQEPPEPGQETRENIEWVWKIASSPPVVRYIDLNAESFFQLIMEVSNA